MKLTAYSYTNQGGRDHNEDSVRCLTEAGVFVLADGLGGHQCGEVASGLAADVIAAGCAEAAPTPASLLELFQKANEAILDAQKTPGREDMKTTAVALYFDGNRAIWAHTGDSRLYHFYNGEVADLTLDQSVCQLHVLQGEITRQQIPMHPDRSKVLYVLGEETIKPKIHEPVKLQRGRHAFLLCTDGLWERLCEEEIMMDLHWADSAPQWLSSLRTRANLRKYDDVDNNTAVAVIIEV